MYIIVLLVFHWKGFKQNYPIWSVISLPHIKLDMDRLKGEFNSWSPKENQKKKTENLQKPKTCKGFQCFFVTALHIATSKLKGMEKKNILKNSLKKTRVPCKSLRLFLILSEHPLRKKFCRYYSSSTVLSIRLPTQLYW